MNTKKWIYLAVAFLLIGGTAGALNKLKNHQQLGRPGVKTQPLPDSHNLEVVLPEHVLDYQSEKRDQAPVVTDTLPKDTSFGQRLYTAPDRFQSLLNVVLMGTDRTSIHKPQICLTGAGWDIDSHASCVETLHMDRPEPYDLKVMKLVANRTTKIGDKNVPIRGIYVYWFVADGSLSADAVGLRRMGEIAWKMVTTGVLQRWAYISYFCVCPPGYEQQTFDRMKQLITASVPEFQLVPAAKTQAVAAR